MNITIIILATILLIAIVWKGQEYFDQVDREEKIKEYHASKRLPSRDINGKFCKFYTVSQLKRDIAMYSWCIDYILWRVCKFFRYIKNRPLEIIRREKNCRKILKRAEVLGYKVIKKRENGQIHLFFIDRKTS